MNTNGNDSEQPSVSTHGQMHESGILYGDTYSQGGLTKREHFAAMAMQGLLSSRDIHISDISSTIMTKYAIFAVSQADALIVALNK